jgi:aryl-alcohol dehydrogenase-like predicted oxidoreductase
MLDESLRRLRTDHLDLWQIHGVCFESDPDLFIRAGGPGEALEQAQKKGRCGLLDSPDTKILPFT